METWHLILGHWCHMQFLALPASVCIRYLLTEQHTQQLGPDHASHHEVHAHPRLWSDFRQ